MTDTQVLDIAVQAMMITLKLSAPVLLAALSVGFAISVFQSMTQIQEFTLAFVPKLLAVGAALIVSGNWMLHSMVTFTTDLINSIPALLASAG